MLATIKNIDSVYWYRLQPGESAALGFLYDTYADKLFLSAMRLTDDRELAKDAVQEKKSTHPINDNLINFPFLFF